MLRKTEKFMSDLRSDLHWIKLNQEPLKWKGSLKRKKNGDYISDIDFEAQVTYNQELLRVISNVLDKNMSSKSPFTFVYMIIGKYVGYNLPWKIDNYGGCDFDLKKTKEWIKVLKQGKMVPDDVLEKIETKISGDMTIKDLIDIENDIQEYAEIIWLKDDIKRGYITKDNFRYELLEEMKMETPVLEYIYNYNTDYISVDVGLVDENYKSLPETSMYRFYVNDWYKIMKMLRWRIDKKYLEKYLTNLYEIDMLAALSYKVEIAIKIAKHPETSNETKDELYQKTIQDLQNEGLSYKNLSLKYIKNDLYKMINKTLESKINYWVLLVSDPKVRNDIILRFNRAKDAQIPTTQEQLLKRTNDGISCPFFTVDIDEYKILSDLALRVDIDINIIIKCLSTVATSMGKLVAEIMQAIVNNNGLSIIEKNNKIILMKNGVEIEEHPLSEKKRLQIRVLITT